MLRSPGHNGVLGGSLGNKLAATSFYYTDTPRLTCPATHIATFTFKTSNYKSMTLATTTSTTASQFGGSNDSGLGYGLSHPHPGYLR